MRMAIVLGVLAVAGCKVVGDAQEDAGEELTFCVGQCVPAITLKVVDAQSGAVITGASLMGAPQGFVCDQGHCHGGSQPGTYQFLVVAQGYAPKQLTVVVPAAPPPDGGCVGCGYIWQDVTVALSTGCEGISCGPCYQEVMLTVKDAATSAPLTSASATGAGGCHCEAERCSCRLTTIGTHEVTVAAAGYQSQTLSLTVTEGVDDPDVCCDGCPVMPADRDVLLTVQQ